MLMLLIKCLLGLVMMYLTAYTIPAFIRKALSGLRTASPTSIKTNHLVLCFDVETYGNLPLEYFKSMVMSQSDLSLEESYKHATRILIIAANEETLMLLAREKSSMDTLTVENGIKRTEMESGEKIDLLMFKLQNITAECWAENDKIIPPPFAEGEALLTSALRGRIVLDYFPLHDTLERKNLLNACVKHIFCRQTLDSIRKYFGDEVGFYFGFLDMFTRWLMLPAFLGAVTILPIDVFASYGKALYSLFITCWATAWLKFWKRRERMLRYKWSIDRRSIELDDEERSAFWGLRKYDPTQKKFFTYYSSIERMKRYIGSSIVMFCSLSGIIALTYAYFYAQYWLEAKLTEHGGFIGYWEYLQLIPSCVFSLAVWIVDSKYVHLASRLTDFENHRTEAEFANAFVLKLSSFYFVNNFASLFYLAFWARDMKQLEQTLSSLLVIRQFLSNFTEILIPFLTAESRVFASKKTEHAADIISQVETELLYPEYNGTFDDYLELFVQFGQISLFASAFPLASLCCFVNNLIEIRTDAFKLLSSYRRPRRNKSYGIGTWFLAFNAIGYLSVVTNCVLIGMQRHVTNAILPGFSWGHIFVATTLFEHVMIAFKICIELFVPDLPSEVITRLRSEHAFRKEKLRQSSLLLERNSSCTGDTDEQKECVTVGEEESIARYLYEEKERRMKLEKQVSTLNDLYLGWVLKERSRRKEAETLARRHVKEM